MTARPQIPLGPATARHPVGHGRLPRLRAQPAGPRVRVAFRDPMRGHPPPAPRHPPRLRGRQWFNPLAHSRTFRSMIIVLHRASRKAAARRNSAGYFSVWIDCHSRPHSQCGVGVCGHQRHSTPSLELPLRQFPGAVGPPIESPPRVGDDEVRVGATRTTSPRATREQQIPQQLRRDSALTVAPARPGPSLTLGPALPTPRQQRAAVGLIRFMRLHHRGARRRSAWGVTWDALALWEQSRQWLAPVE